MKPRWIPSPRLHAVGLILLLAALAGLAQAQTQFHPTNARLLMPEPVIARRTTAQALSNTIVAVGDIAVEWARAQPKDVNSRSCIVYVAIRPRAAFRTWTVCEHIDGSKLDAMIRNRLKVQDIARVREGVVAFSLHGSSAWASGSTPAQMPAEWRRVMGRQRISTEQIIAKAWK